MSVEVGRVCIKTMGRTQGNKVVVLEQLKDGRVVVEGFRTKRKPCNVRHLFPTPQKISATKEWTHTDILKALKEMV